MPPAAENSLVEKLQNATSGLLYLSETDAPLEPFFWKNEAAEGKFNESVTSEMVGKYAQVDASQLKTQSLATFFKPVATEEDWHNEEEKAEVQKFQSLRDLLKSELKNIKVFRTPGAQKQVYVVGQTEGGFAGLKTTVVET